MLNVVRGEAFVVYFSRCFAVLIIENKSKVLYLRSIGLYLNVIKC